MLRVTILEILSKISSLLKKRVRFTHSKNGFFCSVKMTSDVARALSQRKIKAKSTRNLSLLL